MSSSIWARVARTCFIRPRIGSGPVLGRSYVLLAAKPVNNVLLRPIPILTRQQSSAAALAEHDSSQPAEAVEEGEKLPEFASLEQCIHPNIYRSLIGSPFKLKTMSPVQAAVLPLLPEITKPHDTENPSSRDLMVKAKTGTGKTLAFLIPVVQARAKVLEDFEKNLIDEKKYNTQTRLTEAIRRFASAHTGAVIISPTRELAIQIANEARKLTYHLKKFEIQLFVGGEHKMRQLKAFQKGRADIIVATPGRINDILESSEAVANSVAHAQTFVLDEADTLLDMGFLPDIQNILKYLPPSPVRQTFLFSATLSRAIRQVASESLSSDHKYINCVSNDAPPTHAHIPQYHTVVPSPEEQIPHILRLIAHDQLSNPRKSKVIIFLPTTKMTALFASLLRESRQDVLPAGNNTMIYELHSQKQQSSRIRASDAFRVDRSGASVLVTSDVSARGVDYPGVTRVIQAGIPKSGEIYVHRVGRTGRAGTAGRGDLVILPFERKFLSTQMKDLPLKPLTVDEHTAQLSELTQKYDKDPEEFWGGEVPTVRKPKEFIRDSKVPRPTFFQSKSLSTMIEDIPQSLTEIISTGDAEIYDQCFASVVGYYVGLADDLRLPKMEILEECKSWIVGATGIPRPHVSTSMMEKLGITNEMRRMERRQQNDGRRFDRHERGMDDVRKRGFAPPSKSPWMGRGQRRIKETRERQSFDNKFSRSAEGESRKTYGKERDGYKRDGYQRDGYQRDGYQRDRYQRDGYQRDRSFSRRDD